MDPVAQGRNTLGSWIRLLGVARAFDDLAVGPSRSFCLRSPLVCKKSNHQNNSARPHSPLERDVIVQRMLASRVSQVSVVVTSYQGGAFLEAALRSVFEQSVGAIEVLVVDDGSTDGSIEILESFPKAILLRQNRLGVAAARNLGVSEAKAPYIAFLDGDDRWHPRKLERQMECLDNERHVAFALCHQRFFWQLPAPPSWVKPELLAHPHPSFVPGAILARRSCFERVGLFDTALAFGSDSDWIARARDSQTTSGMVPEALLFKRLHSANASAFVQDNLMDLRRLLRKSAHRKQGRVCPSIV